MIKALYSALCIDNSNFFKTGRIIVRIFQFSGIPLFDEKGKPTGYDDLKTDAKLRNIKDSKGGLTIDFEAMVFAPLGGGRNYGMFMLPQINSKGIVTFLDGDLSKPLWLGSFFDNLYDKDGKRSGNINIPNDNPDSEKGADQDGAIKKEKKIDGDVNTIILRTKHTTNSDEGVNWEKNNTENLVAIDDKKVRIRHNTKWKDDNTTEKYQEILINKDSDNSDKETITLDVNNITDDKRGILKLTEDGFKIEIIKGSESTIFEINLEGSAINFEDQYGNKILGTEDGLFIDTKVKDKKLFLNGSDVSLVTYDQLKIIAEKFAEHIHYGKTGSLITSGPIETNKADVNIKQAIKKMEAEVIKTKQK